MVIELPLGLLICIAMNLNQRWVLDRVSPDRSVGVGGREHG